MATVVKMPKLGTTMTEGTIIRWIKKEGEAVEKGEPYVEIQTDKVNIEDEAESSGIIRKIFVQEGDTVSVGEPIAIIAGENEPIPDIKESSGESEISSELSARSDESFISFKEDRPVNKIKASPAAKRVAKENNVDLSEVVPTGPDGRIVEKDVISYIQENKIKATPVAKKMAKEMEIDLKDIQKEKGQRITKQDLLDNWAVLPKKADEIPVEGMRKIIAEKMSFSKQVAPHIYLSLEVDMTKIIHLRKTLSEHVQKQYGVKLSYNDILIKTVATALRQFPIINSSFYEEKIVIKPDINIGLAVALDDGLIVPVVKNADKKGIADIARETADLVQKAREKKLLPDECQEGTFTITNLGMYDIENFSAIINQPESAILAVGKIIKKPVVVNDEIQIRPMANFTLSCDHRTIDGAVGAKFLQKVKQILEEPIFMLL